jgi:outer membrane assembly lipoprotein YfiO
MVIPSMNAFRTTLILGCLVAAVASLPALAQAAWVWSPQTGWIGPGGAVKDSPEEQLAFAVAFFDRKEYDTAERELKKLLRHYTHSREAAEAQYYLGRCFEEKADYYKAFQEYRKTLQVYPSTKRFDEILEREYQIGNYFLGGKKRMLLGAAAVLPAKDKAVEVFKALSEDGPFSEYGELAQYKLGLAHLALLEYEEAVTAFEQVTSRYPDSPLVDDARYQIAQASLKGVFKPGYDQSPTDMAIQELDAFLTNYPESGLSKEAGQRVETLKEQRAAHEFEVAQFYERRKQPASAKIFYQNIIRQYSETSWAPKAAARLQALDALVPQG